MKDVKVYKSESKSKMENKQFRGTISNFPENRKELESTLASCDDGQVTMFLHLMEVQLKIFTRDKLGGNTMSFTDCLKLETRVNYKAAIANTQAEIKASETVIKTLKPLANTSKEIKAELDRQVEAKAKLEKRLTELQAKQAEKSKKK